jgi:hypothetical protein
MNIRLLKIVGFVALGFVLALAAGYVWGSAGRRDLHVQLEAATRRFALVVARERLASGRVAVYGLNFGDAARGFESAHVWTTSAAQQFRIDGDEQMAARLVQAAQKIDQARSLAASVNQDANNRAAAAEALLDNVLREAASFDVRTARPR